MTTEVKSRPILFKGPLVRAILEGRKSQTRRIVNLSGPRCASDCKGVEPERAFRDPGFGDGEYMHLPCKDDAAQRVYCPYGNVGDELWVRETWRVVGGEIAENPETEYAADASENKLASLRWRPSIFMPRWASRLTLRIIDVRVQRLQEISEEDAIAEGVPRIPDAELVCHCGSDLKGHGWGDGHSFTPMEEHRYQFSLGWNEINAQSKPARPPGWSTINMEAGSWESNPWVWCLSFERAESHP